MDSLEQIRSACGALLEASGRPKGTAFLISPTLALTAAHNVAADGPLTFYHKGVGFETTVEVANEAIDTAILRLSKSIEGTQPLQFSFDAQRGDVAYIYGFPSVLGGVGITIDALIQDSRVDVPQAKRPILVLSMRGNISEENLSGISGSPVIIGSAVVGLVCLSFRGFGLLGATAIQDALEVLPSGEYTRVQRNARPPSSPGRTDSVTVAVVAALDEELDYLLDLPYSWSGPQVSDDGLTYRLGHLEGRNDIVAASPNSMGLTEMAILTTKVIKTWSPRLLAMIGVCGGRKEKGLSLGDIVIPTQTFHYQFGSYRDGLIHRELRVENSDRQLLDFVTHLARRTDTLAEIKKALPRGFAKPLPELQCHFGPMASADLVVKDPNKIQEAIEADRKTIAIEMESFAFMKAAALARVRWVLVAKSVTDYADATKDDEFREYAKYTSTSLFVEVARALLSSGQIG